jgi:ubiquinone/menaquinone biosynthesis C-methylase UbiE
MSGQARNFLNRTSSGQGKAWDEVYSQEHPRWRGPSDLDLGNLEGRTLELGCGDGKTAIALIEKGLMVVGFDLSRTALSVLSKRSGSERLSLVQGNALDLPFAEGVFDCVTAAHVIDHLLAEERSKAVDEIRRVLRPHGLVIGRFFSIDDMRFGKGKEIEPNTYLKGNGVLNHYFSEHEIISLFSGFKVMSIGSTKKPTKFSSDSGYRALITAELRKR